MADALPSVDLHVQPHFKLKLCGAIILESWSLESFTRLPDKKMQTAEVAHRAIKASDSRTPRSSADREDMEDDWQTGRPSPKSQISA